MRVAKTHYYFILSLVFLLGLATWLLPLSRMFNLPVLWLSPIVSSLTTQFKVHTSSARALQDILQHYNRLRADNAQLKFLLSQARRQATYFEAQALLSEQAMLVKPLRIVQGGQKHVMFAVTQQKLSESKRWLADGEVLVGKLKSSGGLSEVLEIQLLQDAKSAVSVYVKNTAISGLLIGLGQRGMKLAYVPDTKQVRVGDIVCLNYPEDQLVHGLKAGRVSSVSRSARRDFLIIEVLPYYDLEHDKWYTLV